MTDDMLSTMKFDTPRCHSCGQVDKQLFDELAGKDDAKCSFCGGSIPLTDPAWVARFQEMVKGVKEIYKKR